MPEFAEKDSELVRAKVALQKYIEGVHRGEIPDAHFLDKSFNIDDLTAEDLRMWSLTFNKTVTEDEFGPYNRSFRDPEGFDRPDTNPSRLTSIFALRNLVEPIFYFHKEEKK